MVNADGTNLRELDTLPEFSAYESPLQWVPGMHQILYALKGDNIRLVDTETGHIRAITQSSSLYSDQRPVLAPNRKQVVFERWPSTQSNPKPDLCIVDIDGQNLHCLLKQQSLIDKYAPFYRGEPVWSPDSRYIAYIGTPSAEDMISLLVIDTFDAKAIATVVANDLADEKIAWIP